MRDCFLADDGEMVLFGDQSQNIYKRPSDSRASPIVLGFGMWFKLEKSYRSKEDSPLVQMFKNFQSQHLIQKYTDSENFETSLARKGQENMVLDLLSYETYGATYDSAFISEKIHRYIRKYQLIPNDIAIVSSKVELLIPLNEALNQSEKTKIMFEDASEVDAIPIDIARNPPRFRDEIEKIRRRKKSFFMQNSGLIKLSTIHSFKGLVLQP